MCVRDRENDGVCKWHVTLTIGVWCRRLEGSDSDHCGSSVADTCWKDSSWCVSGTGKNDGVCKWHVALTIVVWFRRLEGSDSDHCGSFVADAIIGVGSVW